MGPPIDRKRETPPDLDLLAEALPQAAIDQLRAGSTGVIRRLLQRGVRETDAVWGCSARAAVACARQTQGVQ